MKPIASSITEIDNLPGEEVNFSISPANSAWVMRSMADLYSNRELAVVREYSTNARDAMIESGHGDEPIVVTLPNAMNPYFSVQDFGIGMSEAELKEVYTQFGESTKRDSDDYNGMLGFGSKSAVAYTNTFTVTSVKDGHKTVAVITRREDAMGGYLVTLKIVLTVRTSERNGVTIQVPVHNWREFVQKANDFYKFWLPGTVLVNGSEPEWAVGEKIDTGLFYYPQHGQSFVVMGNVAYRIANPDALFPRGMNKISFVAYVDNGVVEFTPSREDLKYSEHTKKNLHKIIEDFCTKAIETAKKEIANASTHAEAFTAWMKWRSVVGAQNVPDLTYKGDALSEYIKINGYVYTTSQTRYNTSHTRGSYPIQQTTRTFIVTDFGADVSSTQKKIAREWAVRRGTPAYWFLFTQDSTVASPWVDPARIVSWATIKAETPKPPKKPRAVQVNQWRKAGSFDLITKSGRLVEQDVPSTKELYYVMVQDFNKQEGNLSGVLSEFDVDAQVVLLPANRKDKFLRFYPYAKPIIPFLESKVILNGPSLLTPDAMTYLAIESYERSMIESLSSARIDDPDLVALINLVKVGESAHTQEYRKHYRLANLLGIGQNFVKHKYTNRWDAKNKPMSKKYPLAKNVRNASNEELNHIYFYINSCHKARKEGRNV